MNLKYREAIAQATMDAMADDPAVVVMGVGVTDAKGIFGTTKSAHEAYPDRVLETPLSENALTGACVGMALEGLRPLLVHARCDFLPLTFEHLVNTAAKWRFMSKGRPLPIVIRAIIGQGWGQGPTHSQALHAMLGHVPGLKVYMPFRPSDAYWCLRHALRQDDPVVILEHRRLYETEGRVAEPGAGKFRTWWGGGNLLTDGKACTIVGFSAILLDCLEAVNILSREYKQECALMDAQAFPLPRDMIVGEVMRTGRLVVADTGWGTCGASAEVIAMCSTAGVLKTSPKRVTPPFKPCGASQQAEEAWYPKPHDIVGAVMRILEPEVVAWWTVDKPVADKGAKSEVWARDGRQEPF